MFRRRKNINDIFGDFDAIFSQFESMFGGMPNDSKTEKVNDESGDWTKETYSSPDGSIYITNFVRTNSSQGTNKSFGLNALKKKLQMAIEGENFEEAVKLRDEIKTYESNQDSINKLEMELKKSIEIRDQLKKLKS